MKYDMSLKCRLKAIVILVFMSFYDYMKYDMWLRCRLTVIVVFVYMKYDTSLIKLNVNIL